METALQRYINKVIAVADIKETEKENQVRQELKNHLDEKIAYLLENEYPSEEAILKAIEDMGNPTVVGYKFRKWRFLDVRLKGTAKGFIAVGPKAKGVIAIGGFAAGIISCGGFAVGLLSFGGISLGLLFAFGGLALGALTIAGLGIGILAFGGFSIGIIASGGMALGLWVPGAGHLLGRYFDNNTVPGILTTFDHLLSFNPNQPGQRSEFFKWTTIFFGLVYLPMIIMMIFQGFLMKKEHNRVKEIDPAVAE